MNMKKIKNKKDQRSFVKLNKQNSVIINNWGKIHDTENRVETISWLINRQKKFTCD